MYRIKADHFDLKKICDSGQIFRMYELKDGEFSVYAGQRYLRLSQNGNEITFFCDRSEYEAFWHNYFDLGTDYGKMAASVDVADTFLTNAMKYGSGIRVLRQDIWEMIITFIISQQKQIKSIRKCVEALCERFGREYCDSDSGVRWHGFPSAAEILSGGREGLEGLSLGYRARYIYETAQQYLEWGIGDDELRGYTYEEARKYLCGFTGIGEKVANCICLFGVGFPDAFPIDVHIKDILYREYYRGEKEQKKLGLQEYEALINEHFSKYTGYRGIIQQWIFAYEIAGNVYRS